MILCHFDLTKKRVYIQFSEELENNHLHAGSTIPQKDRVEEGRETNCHAICYGGCCDVNEKRTATQQPSITFWNGRDNRC
jgi:hypothetical protein